MRIDKWLWHARFFKTRGQAADLVGNGRVRINGSRAPKPAAAVRPGDTLTFPQAGRIRVVRIAALSVRRGPAVEAAALYLDLDDSAGSDDAGAPVRDRGRPDRNERRRARLERHGDLNETRRPNT